MMEQVGISEGWAYAIPLRTQNFTTPNGHRYGRNRHRRMFQRLNHFIRERFASRAELGSSNLLLASHSCFLTGWFDFSGQRISGWAENTLDPWDQSLTILVIRGRDIIALTRVQGKSPIVGWYFSIETGSQVSSDEILSERVRVLVRHKTGEVQGLRLEGSTQLELIRELLTDLVMPLVEIDFSQYGNSSEFAAEGWSGQEKIHRWTDGEQSSLVLDFPLPDRSYALQLLLWPFIVPHRLVQQRLRILVNGIEIAQFSVTQQMFLRCIVPAHLFSAPGCTIIRFIHPDAATPASLGGSDDDRRLAFAFKKVKIVPVVA